MKLRYDPGETSYWMPSIGAGPAVVFCCNRPPAAAKLSYATREWASQTLVASIRINPVLLGILWVRNPAAVEELIAYLEKRRAYIPNYQ